MPETDVGIGAGSFTFLFLLLRGATRLLSPSAPSVHQRRGPAVADRRVSLSSVPAGGGGAGLYRRIISRGATRAKERRRAVMVRAITRGAGERGGAAMPADIDP